MNLVKLFELQKGLDAPYSDVEDRLSKDILWLMEELGELAREWRGHKYRRARQTPNTDEWDHTYIDDKNKLVTVHINPLLEEYTDCLSIILSIGLQIGVTDEFKEDYSITFSRNARNPMKKMIMLFSLTREVMINHTYYEHLLDTFFGIGHDFGFTWEQIEQNYLQKVITNGHRNCQAEGHRDDRTA